MAEKYQIPDLKPIDFSLTDGTSIPAPAPEPPTPPKAEKSSRNGPLSSHPTTPTNIPGTPTGASASKKHGGSISGINSSSFPSSGKQAAPGTSGGIERRQSKRQSFVRKFLGLKSHNVNNPAHAGSTDSLTSAATAPNTLRKSGPGAAGADENATPASMRTNSLRRKSSTSWFGSKRKGGVFSGDAISEIAQINEKKGPPPPALPELKSLGVDEEAKNLDGDAMFRDIK